MTSTNEIAILDFGSQYTHLIARRIRELGVVSHIYPPDADHREFKNAVGLILSGGPRSVLSDPPLPFNKKIFHLNLPILGLCYGHQLLAQVFGGRLASGTAREYGLARLTVASSPIFKNVKKNSHIWMSHGDHVAEAPSGFKIIASTGNDSVAAMGNEKEHLYGFQFHPEVTHSEEGEKMLKNFVFTICRAKKNWNRHAMLTQIEQEIKEKAGNKNVFLLVSGGVDSAVCFALLEKVLGQKRVYGLHIDNGFMRLNETKKIASALAKAGFKNLHLHDAEIEFLSATKAAVEPEEKRKIIGNLFLDITDRLMAEKGLDGDRWLIGQGTIYPDTIESGGTRNADLIKTHHNRVPRIKEMILEGKIIEPIKELYKDEVREIGSTLGLPPSLIGRHPFPGPGLAIRCLCSGGSTEKIMPLEGLDVAVEIFKLPIKSVGVQGDERSYSHPAVITKLPKFPSAKRWQFLASLAPHLTNTHKDINRVMLLLSGTTKELRQASVRLAFLTKKRLDTLRVVDNIVTKEIAEHACGKKIWQFPTVLVPFGNKYGESIVLRPVESAEAMTVTFSRIPETILKRIIAKIKKLNAVDFIFYDLTNKPPGTIEWE